MNKEIFNLFTLKNKIILPQENFNFLVKNIMSNTHLKLILQKYLKHFGNKIISLNELMTLFKKNEIKKLFLLENVDDKTLSRLNLIHKYNYFKNNYNAMNKNDSCCLICDLRENVKSCIFGIIYKNLDNEFVCEDKSQIILLNFDQNKNFFVTSNIFVFLYGSKVNEIFYVEKVTLPGKSNSNKKEKINFNEKIDNGNSEKHVIEYATENHVNSYLNLVN